MDYTATSTFVANCRLSIRNFVCEGMGGDRDIHHTIFFRL